MNVRIDGVVRRRAIAIQQNFHVGRGPGHPQQPALAIQHMAQCIDRHAAFLQQIQQNPGIDAAGAGAHHQAIEGGETHRSRDAVPAVHRAQTRSAAEMSRNDPGIV
jgi:hypothetical protein